MYKKIRQAIIDHLNSDVITKIAVAYRTDRSEIAGYPAALVFPAEHEADYFQTGGGSNKETYIFTIRILYPFTEGQEEADLALEEAVDELIRNFRNRDSLGIEKDDEGNDIGSVVDWIEPVPGRWGYQDRGNGTMRIAELNIRCVKYVE